MISRCPSCGAQTAEDAPLCPSCGWDFVARARRPTTGAAPAPVEPPKPDGLSLPPAKNLNAGAPPAALKPPASPALGAAPAENPFTLPQARPRLVEPPPAREETASVPPPPPPAAAAAPSPKPVPVKPSPAPVPRASVPPAAEARAEEPVSQRRSPVLIASVAGAVLGTASVLALYFHQRAVPPPARPAEPAPASLSPASPPAAIVAPPAGQSRPSATFASAPRVVVAGETKDAAPAPPPVAPEPDATAAPAPAKAGPDWTFEGTVFDVLRTRGVFGATLTFYAPDGKAVGHVETGPEGRYKIVLPFGGAAGYTLKISQPDYAARYLDEGEATDAMRQASPEERKLLMQASSRNRPWIGLPDKAVRRDLALVPRAE